MSDMQYRRLGTAGLKVSSISLGGWINFENKLPEAEARAVVRTAYEAGVNLFDLADVYGFGEAERWMGGMLAEFPRHTVVISTKTFWPMSDDVNDRGLSRKHIFESIDKSLKRLGTDYVDIYFCHRADPETPVLETARAMDDLIRAGKVLYWGTSEWEAGDITEAVDVCAKHGLHPPQVEQPQYSMLARERVEHQILPVAKAAGMGLVVFSPLAMGMLTGKYDDGIPDDSRFARESWAKERYWNDEATLRVRRLKGVADDLGMSRAQLALAWAMGRPGISSVIVGATNRAQMTENLGALDAELNDEVWSRIDEVLGEAP